MGPYGDWKPNFSATDTKRRRKLRIAFVMQRERCKKRWTISRLLPPISREGRDRIDNEYEKRREKEGGNGIRRRKRRVDGKLMPGINSRRVFINQNRDRVKNPTEMYAFSALRLGRMRNKQRDKHYEVAAVEASSVINAARHPVHTHTHTRARAHACTRGCERRERERERERGSTRSVLAKNL